MTISFDGGRRRPRVLVVDDDRLNRAVLADALAYGFEVITAADAEAGLELLETQAPDVVIADQVLPGLAGVQLLSIALGNFPTVARLLVTSSSRPEDARDAVNIARVHRFLSKPLRSGEIAHAVEGALREVQLEVENARLVRELQQTNALLAAHDAELKAEVAAKTQQLREAVAQLQQLALRDGLTGLYNHRHFQEALVQELARASRHRRALGLLFIDVDHFKAYNDRLGHPRGDALLRGLAELLGASGERGRTHGRRSDIVCRYGGEEFVILLPEVDREGARIRGERICAEIAAATFPGAAEQPLGRVSVSVGIASFPQDASDREGLVHAADEALLEAKRRGRNQVCTAVECAERATPT